MVTRTKECCAHVATDVATWWRRRHRLSHRQQATGRAAADRGRVALRRPSAARPCAYNSCSSPGLCRPYSIPAVPAASKICPITNALSTRGRGRVGLYRHIAFSSHPASCERNCKTYGVYRSESRAISDPKLVSTLILDVVGYKHPNLIPGAAYLRPRQRGQTAESDNWLWEKNGAIGKASPQFEAMNTHAAIQRRSRITWRRWNVWTVYRTSDGSLECSLFGTSILCEFK